MAKLKGMSMWDWIAIVLMIVGSVAWGLIGLFNFNLVEAIFGQIDLLERAIYTLVGASGVYSIIRFAMNK